MVIQLKPSARSSKQTVFVTLIYGLLTFQGIQVITIKKA